MSLFRTFYDANFWNFLICTVVLCGSAAYVTGKAIAETWRPLWQVIAYALALGSTARFIQYALFEERLLSLRNYLVDIAILIAVALLGYVLARRRQMDTQYGWSAAKHG